MAISLASVKKKNLTKNDIKQICLLKNSFWKYGLKKQLIWFKTYIKKNDLNVLLKINDKIVGYVLLRKRTLYISKKKYIYLLFDTLIIKKNFRKKNLSKLIINFTNIIMIKEKKIGVLYCNKKLINFYLLFNWKKINKKILNIVDHHTSLYPLIYNLDINIKIKKLKKILVYTKS